jgi:hypothetical protein
VGLSDDVRAACAAIARDARHVRIETERIGAVEPGPEPALDPACHVLEAPPADVAAFTLTLDAINFGSGWFPTLDKRPGHSGYRTISSRLADFWRAEGGWSPAELRAMRADVIAGVLGQRRDHELMALHAQALRELGRFLGARSALDLVAGAAGSAERLAATVGTGMALWADRGFYKRAQILASDLSLAGVASFNDLDSLTIFADNLVPHVLRVDGVLVYDDALAAHIDAGELLPPDRREREIRACAVHACELLARETGVPPRILDGWLWNRGQSAEYKAIPRHRTRTVFY